MTLEELDRLTEIDVSEDGTIVYTFKNGIMEAAPEEWHRPQWAPGEWRQGTWTRFLDESGILIWGCFEEDRLAGIVVYRPRLTGSMAQLLALFVSKDQRRKSIASRLCQRLYQAAIQDGHNALYVSATPSKSAVGFYLSEGFAPTQDVHPELFALEPEDIHMVKQLPDFQLD